MVKKICTLIPLLCLMASGLNAQIAIDWTATVGLDHNSATQTLTKTAPEGWNNSGARSKNKLEANCNGKLTYTATEITNNKAIGLSTENSDQDINSMDYAMVFSEGEISTYEEGNLKGSYGNVQVNDVFALERIEDQILYKKNGKILRQTTTDPGKVLMVDVALYSDGMTLGGLTADFTASQNIEVTVEDETPEGLGSIELEPAFGTDPYHYSWSDGDQSRSRFNLESGIYRVTVIDTLRDSVNLIIPVGMELRWTGIKGVKIKKDALVRTPSKKGGSTNALASLENVVGGEGEIMITIEELGKKWSFGYRLETKSQATNYDGYNGMDYAFYVDESNTLYSWVNSKLKNLGTVEVGDVISLARTKNLIQFKKNDFPLHQIEYNPSNQYRVDFALTSSKMKLGPVKIIKFPFWPKPRATITHNTSCYGSDDGAIDLQITGAYVFATNWVGPNGFSASTQDISGLAPGAYTVTINYLFGSVVRTYQVGVQINWKNIVGATATGSTLISSVPNGYGNSGASSLNVLPQGQSGWFEFSVTLDPSNPSALNALTAGFSSSDPDQNFQSINFGFYFQSFTSPVNNFTYRWFRIIENGNVSTGYNWFTSTDVFKIKYNSQTNKMRYYKNGAPIVLFGGPPIPYTSNGVPAANYIVDASLATTSEGISTAFVSFGCPKETGTYVKLKKKLDGGYYYVYDKMLRFQYKEEYEVGEFRRLAYNIYDKDHNLVGGSDATGNILAPGSQILDNTIGENKFDLNVTWLGLALNEYYTLEVFNDKQEKKVLKFKVYN